MHLIGPRLHQARLDAGLGDVVENDHGLWAGIRQSDGGLQLPVLDAHVERQAVIWQRFNPCNEIGLQAKIGVGFVLIDAPRAFDLCHRGQCLKMRPHGVALFQRRVADHRGNARVSFGLLQNPTRLIQRLMRCGGAFEEHHGLDQHRACGGLKVTGQERLVQRA